MYIVIVSAYLNIPLCSSKIPFLHPPPIHSVILAYEGVLKTTAHRAIHVQLPDQRSISEWSKRIKSARQHSSLHQAVSATITKITDR